MANPGQISPLPGFTRYITSHNNTGQAIIHSQDPGTWLPVHGNSMGFSVAYTTSDFPVNLNKDADIAEHERLIMAGKLGLVNPGGTVCRVVDFSPGRDGLMHRTQSLDYGIVLEGQMEMMLDSGESRLMRRGDIAVQRATMHAWRNPSPTEWARMLFVLQDCQPLTVGGKDLGEDLGASDDIKPSR
ncbi:cupin domain-containing protein [Hirsutella rhossiliensis]|uniref:Cupin domain-containing protein n=1 Tax=Hirsutella rhossiliensis TaxID=111463 RepID=A0A9P8MNX0_9HYPO|nr:cupin domain-containing protein [Hirsutella rhossiliensis]KAH0958958.1 cupin domain-containing protein [Hirsutella rhossiliensis]